MDHMQRERAMKKSVVLLFVFVAISIIFSAGIVQAKGKPGGGGEPPIAVPFYDGEVKLDGEFDEWAGCQRIPLYHGGKTFKDPIAETCFMSDGNVLYVAGWPVEGNQINLKVESIHLKVGKHEHLNVFKEILHLHAQYLIILDVIPNNEE